MMLSVFPQVLHQAVGDTSDPFSVGEHQYAEYDLNDQQKEQECGILNAFENKRNGTKIVNISDWGEYYVFQLREGDFSVYDL